MSLQQEIIARFKVKPEIDVEQERELRVNYLKLYLQRAGATGYLIAISGGLDSAVAAGLCKQATDELSSETGQPYVTLALFQPYAEQSDIAHSYEVADAFQLSLRTETNIEEAVDEISLEVEHSFKAIQKSRHISHATKGNIKARTRMVMQYAIAQELNLLVVGTDHASEAITGFFTKWGDGAVDLEPLQSLNKRQVYQLGALIGVPTSVMEKTPTAGLWDGQTDENELGIKYSDINNYLEGKAIDPVAQEKLEKQYLRSEHKRSPIPGI
ncbi:ammonia-dependent NAD(+) synthetase [Paenibacillus yanchengensis]|uniref:NH(3)-dependent NAD(+) synthetase n=1 Tax=Paenibacillus yanchengensis TaxID=2035833 RepID=A0ABW4YI84_9BACL